MAEIHGHCPTCGEVGLDPRSMRLLAAPRGSTGTPIVVFRCPGCGRAFSCGVDAGLARMLGDAGVEISTRSSGFVGGHPERPPSGPPFTLDDLLDFHELLATDDWFAVLFDLVVHR